MNKKIEVNEEAFINLIKGVEEIRICLIGDELHPDGLVQQVKNNTVCVQRIKRKQAGFFAVIGGAWTIFTLGISLLIIYIKQKI